MTSVMGKPLNTQTYRITINAGMITDRRRVEPRKTTAPRRASSRSRAPRTQRVDRLCEPALTGSK